MDESLGFLKLLPVAMMSLLLLAWAGHRANGPLVAEAAVRDAAQLLLAGDLGVADATAHAENAVAAGAGCAAGSATVTAELTPATAAVVSMVGCDLGGDWPVAVVVDVTAACEPRADAAFPGDPAVVCWTRVR